MFESETDEKRFVGAEGLAAERFHAHGKAGKDGVAGDVGEADGKSTAG